ncbi:MAG: Radical Pyruvate-formate lyase-activating enzyme like protein [Myxococcaceae bacterium]|nr:Radical Pyruvate-formate lyase-activating enzyme like protein [Myxococcaceae bacterium]
MQQLAELGVRAVTLVCGEAYLRDDWLELVRAIRGRGMECGMTSGGRGLHGERARAAAASGLQTLSISLDGLQTTHDRLRGARGSYRAALDALTNLRAAGVPVSVDTQLHRLSMPELAPLLEVVIAHGVHSWQLKLTVGLGRAQGEPEVLLQPHELLALAPRLSELEQRCDEAGVRLWPGREVGDLGPYLLSLRGSVWRPHCASWGAACGSLGIEFDGSINACPLLPSEAASGGNVRDAPLRELWERCLGVTGAARASARTRSLSLQGHAEVLDAEAERA